MRALLYLFLLPATVSGLRAEVGYFDFHQEAQRIYQQILSLRLDEAEKQLLSLERREPGNLIVHHLANYIDFFRLYISEDEVLFAARLPERRRRIVAVSAGDDGSPYHRYVEAEIRLHWALIRIRFEQYFPAFQDINRAHKLLLENQRLFPDFTPNLKDLGILHAAVGTIPDQFKWGVRLLSSLKGTVEEGRRELERMLQDTGSPYHLEAAVLHSLLLLHLANQPEIAWQRLQQLPLQPTKNPLHCFVLANLAMRTQRNDRALRYLEERPYDRSFLDFPYLDFMHGLARLRRLEPGARLHFQSYLLRFRGQHFVKEAQQKIAWAELLRGNEAAYKQCMQGLLEEGSTTAGGDAHAQKAAQSGQVPHLGLLKARLLFDGGYFERAREELDRIAPGQLDSDQERLEYYYRTGRVHDGARRTDQALAFYERTIAEGKKLDTFFACKAALQAGLLEEARGRFERARYYWEVCLSIYPDEYRVGLHLQAKAGLSRLQK